MNSKISTKMISEISLLLALGFVLKLVTDILLRTAFSFLFIDVLLIVTVIILFKYPTLKVALTVAGVQTAISATLFTATDMWFVRPIIVMIAFVVIITLNKRKWKDKTRFVWSLFLTSKLTVLTVSLLFIGLFFLIPDFLTYNSISGQLEGAVSPDSALLLEEHFISVMIACLLLLGLIYAYIPASAHLLIGFLLYPRVKRFITKREVSKVESEDENKDL